MDAMPRFGTGNRDRRVVGPLETGHRTNPLRRISRMLFACGVQALRLAQLHRAGQRILDSRLARRAVGYRMAVEPDMWKSASSPDEAAGMLHLYRRGAALLGALLLFAVTAEAQIVSPPFPAQATEEGLRRQEERTRAQQQQLEPQADVLHPEAKSAIATRLPEETPCFPIREIAFAGEYAQRFHWLSDAVAPFLGQCAGAEGLGLIVSALDARLIEFGYVTTRASLPAQNLQTGRLQVQLHVGRVADVAMAKAGAPLRTPDAAWGTWRSAFPLGRGDILNVRDLEQGVEQMKRLPSQSVTARLEPGPEPDTSLVVIERQTGSWRERVRGGLTIDNAGSPALGRTQLAGYLALDNPLGLNDILLLSGNTNAEHPGEEHRSQSGSVNYSVPWGYNLLSVSASRSRFAQIVQGTTARFLSSGSSETTEARWHRTVWRTASLKAGGYAAVSTRRAESFLDDVEVLVQRRRTTNLEAGLTYRQLVGQAVLDLDIGYRHGVARFGAQEDLASAATGGATLRPRIASLTASYSQPFALAGRPVQYSAVLRGQHTRDTTLSIDQIAIGNRYSVRGFDGDSVLLAESGYFVRNELSTPLKLAAGAEAFTYLGVDAGRVWGASAANLVGNKLAGFVAGVRGRYRALQVDLSLGTPLYKPEGFVTRRLNPYVSATYAF
jgi:hemolysin activation/secretion protein